MKSSNVFADYAPKYFEIGIPVIPTAGKRAISSNWTKWSNVVQTASEVEELIRQYPHADIGTVMGRWGLAIDIDVDDRCVIEALPYSPLMKVGKKGVTAIYRQNLDIKSAHHQAFDILNMGKQTILPPSIHPETELPYRWTGDEDIFKFDLKTLPSIDKDAIDRIVQACEKAGVIPKKNEFNEFTKRPIGRNQKLAHVAYAISQKSYTLETAMSELLEADDKLHSSHPNGPWFRDTSESHRGKNREGHAAKMITRAMKKSPAKSRSLRITPVAQNSVEALGGDAYYGLLGKTVRLIEPHSESDPAAILGQCLVAFGNLVGRQAHWTVEGGRHHLNLFLVLVGPTAGGRKGTSWSQVSNLMNFVEAKWRANCVKSGLSSCEGLIYAVRDPISKFAPSKKPKSTQQSTAIDVPPDPLTIKKLDLDLDDIGEWHIVDHGVNDKRLLALEQEFSSVLKNMSREGNTLSDCLRNLWDSGTHQSLVKNNPYKTTDAHVSMIGHITRIELRKNLTSTDSANGFGNRILWLGANRSKLLPHGGALPKQDLIELAEEIKISADYATSVSLITRSREANRYWEEIYEDLSSKKFGIVGSLTARAEAQVMRIASIYSLLDSSSEIEVVHLKAALAIVRYSESTVKDIFGDTTGDKVADKILDQLEVGGGAMSLTDIHQLLNKNVAAITIRQAVAILLDSKLVEEFEDEAEGKIIQKIRRIRTDSDVEDN